MGDELRRELLALRNPDGGWGYYASKKSRLEPTCWALIALAEEVGEAAVRLLSGWPDEGGLLRDVEGAPPNYAFTALAGLTLLACGAPLQGRVATLAERIAAGRGRALPQTPLIRQDNSIAAWPWIDETASWVEPTAWCVLLLKRLRSRERLAGADERIRDGERMLIDRLCVGGGWNYGNSHVYDHDLAPHLPPTALGLLALQDARSNERLRATVKTLQHLAEEERSTMAFSLATISLGLWDGVPERAAERLLDLVPQSRARGHVLSLAMAATAQRMLEGGANAFRL